MSDKVGKLLTPDIKLHRRYFDEMVRLLGVQVTYFAPKPDKTWTNYAEISSNYENPILIGCIFTEHPDQKTMKKIGWVSELQEDVSIIHVPYNLPGIQVGALFEIPSGLDNGEDRLFRVTQLSNIMIYPASIACQIVPEYKDTYEPTLNDFRNHSFNLLRDEEDMQ